MISYFALHEFAARVIGGSAPSEADLRRGISALYYGLFHRLTAAGAAVFADGGPALQAQAARAFNHAPMREICKRYAQSPARPFAPPLDALVQHAPDLRLAKVADAFVKLQAARVIADYELTSTIVQQDCLDLLESANAAHRGFSEVAELPATRVFRTALLPADRWTRRG